MERRNFLGNLLVLPTLTSGPTPLNDREYWLQTLLKVAEPVLVAAAAGQLKEKMPVEAHPDHVEIRRTVTHLEALGRTMAGLAPWLAADVPQSEVGRQRRFAELARQAIARSVDPNLPSYLNFTENRQPLVDTAFMAHGLMRAPSVLWDQLDKPTQQNLIAVFHKTRAIKPSYANWLMFSATVEAALLKFTGQADEMRVDYALRQHEQWYKGDGVYGDGAEFHWDYYNSFVIQPMLLDVAQTLRAANRIGQNMLDTLVARAKRYAVVQERLIAPDGSFAALGRSLAYRCGAFHHLALMALQEKLPDELPPAQVRSALTAVIRRTLEAPGTFSNAGWLQIGLCGHQPSIGETYISTGSLYLCSLAFLPLGLPVTHPFWTGPAVDWTARKIWSGQDVMADHAYTPPTPR